MSKHDLGHGFDVTLNDDGSAVFHEGKEDTFVSKESVDRLRAAIQSTDGTKDATIAALQA